MYAVISDNRKPVSQYIAYVGSMWVGSESYIVNHVLENVFILVCKGIVQVRHAGNQVMQVKQVMQVIVLKQVRVVTSDIISAVYDKTTGSVYLIRGAYGD